MTHKSNIEEHVNGSIFLCLFVNLIFFTYVRFGSIKQDYFNSKRLDNGWSLVIGTKEKISS